MGQDDAVAAVADAVLRSRAGMASRTRGSSFLFLGPTGKPMRGAGDGHGMAVVSFELEMQAILQPGQQLAVPGAHW